MFKQTSMRMFCQILFCLGLFTGTVANAQPQANAYLFGTVERDDELWFWRYDVVNRSSSYVNPVPTEAEGLMPFPQALTTIDPVNGVYCMWGRRADGFRVMMFDLGTGAYMRASNEVLLQGKLMYNPVDGLIYMLSVDREANRSNLVSLNAGTGQVRYFGSIEGLQNDWPNGILLDYSRGQLLLTNRAQAWRTIDLKSGELIREFEVDAPSDLNNLVHDPQTGFMYGTGSEEAFPNETHTFYRFDPDTHELTALWRGLNIDGSLNTGMAGLNPQSQTYYIESNYGTLYFMNLKGHVELIVHNSIFYDSFGHTWSYYSNAARQTAGTRVTGRVLLDNDADCFAGIADGELHGVRMQFEPGGHVGWSSDGGRFVQYLAAGEYSVRFSPETFWRSHCERNPLTFTVPEAGTAAIELEYLLEQVNAFERLDVSMIASPAILGRSLTYTLQYVNTGTAAFEGVLRLCFDNRLSLLNTSREADRFTAGILEWDLSDVPVGAKRQITVEFLIPPDEELRDERLCAELKTQDKLRNDLLLKYSADQHCTQIRASFDPNDMAVMPRGFGSGGVITRDNSTLNYTIRFQNIGNAPAFDVVIRDTLAEHLDLETLHFGAATHNYTVSLLEGGVLEFRFEDIRLPGKAVDEAGSQGSVKFAVDINKDLPKETKIYNRAAIYFDFNKAIITNTVVNTIGEAVTGINEVTGDAGALEDKLELRSLGQNRFVIHGVPGLPGTVSVYSVLGVKVLDLNLGNSLPAVVDLSAQPAGRYLLRIESAGAAIVRSIAVLR